MTILTLFLVGRVGRKIGQICAETLSNREGGGKSWLLIKKNRVYL